MVTPLMVMVTQLMDTETPPMVMVVPLMVMVARLMDMVTRPMDTVVTTGQQENQTKDLEEATVSTTLVEQEAWTLTGVEEECQEATIQDWVSSPDQWDCLH